MSVVPFRQHGQKNKLPNEILHPFFEVLQRKGVNISEFSYKNEFVAYKILSTQPQCASKTFIIFTRADGLTELVFDNGLVDAADAPISERKHVSQSQPYGFEPNEFIDFEQGLIELGKAYFQSDLVSEIWDNVGIKIVAALYNAGYTPDAELDLPSEIYKKWISTRLDRDGKTNSGKRIPHLG